MNSKKENGDFNYNGVPIFNVGFSDFSMFLNCMENNNRILTKNITREDLREYCKQVRYEKNFGVCYEGVIVDLRDFKKKSE